MLRRAPCLVASTRYERHRILPSWRRRTIGTLRAEGQMRPIPALQRFSRRELIPPPRPAVQEPAALPNGQKEGGLAIHTVLLCLFGRSATWGNACAAPSSSPESGTCRSLRLPNRPFFGTRQPLSRQAPATARSARTRAPHAASQDQAGCGLEQDAACTARRGGISRRQPIRNTAPPRPPGLPGSAPGGRRAGSSACSRAGREGPDPPPG